MRGGMKFPCGHNEAQLFAVDHEGSLNGIVLHRMDQSRRAGLLRPNGLAHGDHLNGFLQPDQTRQARGATGSRDNPQRHLRQANARIRRHNAHAAGHGNFSAAPQGHALNCGNPRHEAFINRRQNLRQMRRLRWAVKFLCVCTRCKNTPGTKDNDPVQPVPLRPAHRLKQTLAEGLANGVHRWIAQGYIANMIFTAHGHLHRTPP